MTYAEYMKSNLWRRFRSWALEFYGRRCDLCGAESQLEVHHWTYARMAKERIEDVGVYCRSCHELIHQLAEQKQTYDGLIMKWMDKEELVRPYSWRVADRISERIDRFMQKRDILVWVQTKFKEAAKN